MGLWGAAGVRWGHDAAAGGTPVGDREMSPINCGTDVFYMSVGIVTLESICLARHSFFRMSKVFVELFLFPGHQAKMRFTFFFSLE